MKAKDYLQEIQVFFIYIEQKKRQLEEMRRMCTYLRGASIGTGSKNSNTSDGFTKASDKLLDLELDLTRKIEEYQLMKNERIEMIQSLSKPEYMEVLYKRYVEFKTFERVAYEMNYALNYIFKLHGSAIKEFEKRFSEGQ